MTTQNIADGVRFCSVKTDKFKTCRVNISLAMPLDKSASARAILPFMFSRRCAKYPDFTSLNRVTGFTGLLFRQAFSKGERLKFFPSV